MKEECHEQKYAELLVAILAAHQVKNQVDVIQKIIYNKGTTKARYGKVALTFLKFEKCYTLAVSDDSTGGAWVVLTNDQLNDPKVRVALAATLHSESSVTLGKRAPDCMQTLLNRLVMEHELSGEELLISRDVVQTKGKLQGKFRYQVRLVEFDDESFGMEHTAYGDWVAVTDAQLQDQTNHIEIEE